MEAIEDEAPDEVMKRNILERPNDISYYGNIYNFSSQLFCTTDG